MEHLALTAYPMPPGAPRLMPYQSFPFNGDGYLAATVLRLRDCYGIATAIETGTCLGSTTMFLADHFEQVMSVEVHGPHLAIAEQRLHDNPNALCLHGSSPDLMHRMIAKAAGLILFFLDAHWGDVCPLEAELDAIAAAGVCPVIVIHDWQVPGRSDLGFDHFPDGEPFNTDRIRPRLDAIYGAGGYTISYNDKAEGAMRGVLIAEPA
jgi:hypothetical protein